MLAHNGTKITWEKNFSDSKTKAGTRNSKVWIFLKTWKIWKLENIENDPWNMLNNFCFHIFAQKSLIISEIGNVYFLTYTASTSPSPVSLDVIELIPS